jgi:hypothetical protein
MHIYYTEGVAFQVLMPINDRAKHAAQSSMDSMLRLILTSRVYDVANETPLDVAARLSRRLSNQASSSARICSRSSATSCVAPTTGSRTCRRRNASVV